MINLKHFFVILIVLVIDLSIFVECQQRLGVGNKRFFYSGYTPNSYQNQYKPQYPQYQSPQGYNNQNQWQWPQGYNNQNQWQWPQGYNNQWQRPQNQGQQFPQNQWGSNQWGSSNQWNPNQWPQYQVPQFPNVPNFPKPSFGNFFDIIKKTQQALQIIPKKST